MVSRTEFSRFKSQVRWRGKSVEFGYDDYRNMKIGNCHYCGIEYYQFAAYCEKLGYKTPYMTIDRKDNSIGYVLDNCVASCFICNRIKGNFFTEADMLEIGRKFVRPKFDTVSQEVWETYLENLDYEETR